MTNRAMPVPAVSVVMPTFNARAHLARSIASVLEQSFTDFELLVVDDGSTDGSDAVIGAIRDPRVTCHRLPANRGQSAARNFGIRAARADLIAFNDADDLWLPGKLADQVDTLRRHPSAALCYGNLLRCEPAGRAFVLEAPVVSRGQIADARPTLYATYGIGIQTCLVRRAALLAAGGFDEGLRCFEDLDLFLRLARTGDFVKLDRSLTLYLASHGVSSHFQRNRAARLRLLRRYGWLLAMQRPCALWREIANLGRGRGLGD